MQGFVTFEIMTLGLENFLDFFAARSSVERGSCIESRKNYHSLPHRYH